MHPWRLAILVSILLWAPPCRAGAIAARWKSPSRLTVTEAAFVLYRHASGQPVAAADFFEAEKYLRTDGGVSLGEYVLTEVLVRLLADHVGSSDVRARTLPPVLHWLEFDETALGVRLRGESLQIAVLNSAPVLAATLLYHRTIDQDWRACDGEICWRDAAFGPRENGAYALSVPGDATLLGEARSSRLLQSTGIAAGHPRSSGEDGSGPSPCVPPPAEILDAARISTERSVLRHALPRFVPSAPNWIACAFVALPTRAPSRVSYTVDGRLAAPPSRAARSAVVHNPLDFVLAE